MSHAIDSAADNLKLGQGTWYLLLYSAKNITLCREIMTHIYLEHKLLLCGCVTVSLEK